MELYENLSLFQFWDTIRAIYTKMYVLVCMFREYYTQKKKTRLKRKLQRDMKLFYAQVHVVSMCCTVFIVIIGNEHTSILCLLFPPF
jgi:hypothetical protein